MMETRWKVKRVESEEREVGIETWRETEQATTDKVNRVKITKEAGN